jgi:hypothetical protein
VDEVFAMTAKRVLPGENGDVVSVLLRHASGITSCLNAVLYTPLYLRFASSERMHGSSIATRRIPTRPARRR